MRGGGPARRSRPFARLALAVAAVAWAVCAPPAVAKPEGGLGKAEALLGAGRAREAAAVASRHLDADPSDGAARLLRARARIALRDLPGASADVDEALRRAPGWPQALAVRSLALLAEGKTGDAVDQARGAAEAGPREKWAAWALAKALIASGDTRGGLAALERATRLDPAWVSATIERGKVRERLGDREGALADYERALLLDPGNRSATSARDDLRGRGSDAGAASTAAVPGPSSPAPPNPSPVAVRPESPPGTTSPAVPAGQPGAVSAAATPPVPVAATEAEQVPSPALALPAPGTLPSELLPLAAGGPPPPANVPPFLELNDLSAATWGGAASAAKETMRLVIGPMTPEEEKGFDETWAPLFRFPHEKLVAWLNALNPLLGQYLATRGAAAEAVLGFDAAQLEAAAAAGAGDAAAVAEAMQSAGLAGQLVASLVTRLEATVREIEALGPPPDPEEERKRRHARHVAAFQLPSEFAFEGEWHFDQGSVLRLRLVDGQPDGSVVVLYERTNPPEVESRLDRLGTPFGFDARWPALGFKTGELLPDGRLLLYSATSAAAFDEIELFRLDGEQLERVQYSRSLNLLRPELGPTVEGPFRWTAERESGGKGPPAISPAERAAILKELKSPILGPSNLALWKKQEPHMYPAVVEGTLRGTKSPSETGPAPPTAEASAQQPPVAAPASDAEKKLEDEKVAFHQANISVFERDVAAAERAVAAAKDPASREELTRRLLWAKDALQREKDAVTTIRTGAFTRTRTDADAVNLMIMERQARDQAAYWSEVQRVLDHAPKLIALAPENERGALTDFFRRQVSREAIASGDLGRIRRAASAIGTKVRGGLEADAAAAELEVADASERLAYVESVKGTCDTSLLVLSGVGGTGIATAYMGITGWMKGGPTEAFKQAATTWSAAARVASEAMDAYEKGVVENYEAYAKDPEKVKIDEAAAGFSKAAWSVGQTAGFAALMKTGSMALGGIVGGAQEGRRAARREGLVPRRRRRRPLPAGRGGRPCARRRLPRQGRAARGGGEGGARPGARSSGSGREAEGLYRSIKTDYHAKVEMNAVARAGESRLVHAFNSFDRPAMARLKERVSQRMQADGWSGQQYRTFSNSASKGKIGMDVDLGAVEPPRYVLSGGKQVPNPAHLLWQQTLTQRTPGGLVLRRNPHEFQEAGQRQLDAAFREVYGRSPARPSRTSRRATTRRPTATSPGSGTSTRRTRSRAGSTAAGSSRRRT